MAPVPEHATDLEEDAEVIVLGPEVAEGGEEARYGGEAVRPEGDLPHVGAEEARSGVRLLRPEEKHLGEVETEDAETALGERARVPAGPARQIEHGISGREARHLEQERHPPSGLLLVPMRVESQVVVPEPARVPRPAPGRIRTHAPPLW